MQRVSHRQELYTIGAGESAAVNNIRALAALLAEGDHPPARPAAKDRKLFTRAVDAVFLFTRTYLPPVHLAGAVISAVILLIYARILALTVRLTGAGEVRWPGFPAGSVLAVWHGSAPSVLVALRMRKPRAPVAIMVACDPRGDCVAWLCRMLGMHVVRGDSDHGGWEALVELAREVERGVCALITADGGGPARQAKAGAVALASATGMPLIALGADCRPAIFERHKWDSARTPVLFGRIAIAVGESRVLPLFRSASEVNAARALLQTALNNALDTCRRAVGLPSPNQ